MLGKPRVLPSVMPPSEDEAGTDPSLGGWGKEEAWQGGLPGQGLNCSWNSVVHVLRDLLPQGSVRAGKGREWSHCPHFTDSKLKLSEVCHYQPVSDQTSSPHAP